MDIVLNLLEVYYLLLSLNDSHMRVQLLLYSSAACSKLVVLCDLFARRSGELPQEERHDIIKYAHSR